MAKSPTCSESTNYFSRVEYNLGTHSYGAFYENLPFETARQLKNKLEFHFTPKHGSWLNIAEMEFSALSRQCLDRRIGSQSFLESEVLIWERRRNEKAIKVSGSFTTDKARVTLKNRYGEVGPFDT